LISNDTFAEDSAINLTTHKVKKYLLIFRCMASNKTKPRKNRLMKKTKQNSAVPLWVILKTNRRVRRNPQQRNWRRGSVDVG
jgi:large subunit ribosomal protein L39e